jgi:hypothetical protein
LYGRPPPHLVELLIPADELAPVITPNLNTTAIAQQIKANLQKAQELMKVQADKNKKERELEIGDMVYLKI